MEIITMKTASKLTGITLASATATSACKGQNSCKGIGWVKASKADCAAKRWQSDWITRNTPIQT